jgi:hypothetical protein
MSPEVLASVNVASCNGNRMPLAQHEIASVDGGCVFVQLPGTPEQEIFIGDPFYEFIDGAWVFNDGCGHLTFPNPKKG